MTLPTSNFHFHPPAASRVLLRNAKANTMGKPAQKLFWTLKTVPPVGKPFQYQWQIWTWISIVFSGNFLTILWLEIKIKMRGTWGSCMGHCMKAFQLTQNNLAVVPTLRVPCRAQILETFPGTRFTRSRKMIPIEKQNKDEILAFLIVILSLSSLFVLFFSYCLPLTSLPTSHFSLTSRFPRSIRVKFILTSKSLDCWWCSQALDVHAGRCQTLQGSFERIWISRRNPKESCFSLVSFIVQKFDPGPYSKVNVIILDFNHLLIICIFSCGWLYRKDTKSPNSANWGSSPSKWSTPNSLTVVKSWQTCWRRSQNFIWVEINQWWPCLLHVCLPTSERRQKQFPWPLQRYVKRCSVWTLIRFGKPVDFVVTRHQGTSYGYLNVIWFVNSVCTMKVSLLPWAGWLWQRIIAGMILWNTPWIASRTSFGTRVSRPKRVWNCISRLGVLLQVLLLSLLGWPADCID